MSESVVSETQGMEWGGGQGRNRQTKVVSKREGEVRLYLLLCDDSFGLLQVHCQFIERSPGGFHLGCDQA